MTDQIQELVRDETIVIKQKNKRTLLIIGLIFLAAAAVFTAMFLKFSHDKRMEEQQKLLASISSAGFDQVMKVYPSLTIKEDIQMVEDRLSFLVDQEVERARDAETDPAPLYAMLQSLKEANPLFIDVDTYLQTADSIKQQWSEYEKGQSALAAGDTLSAFASFEQIISAGVLRYPNLQSDYDSCRQTLYQEYVTKASEQIQASDFDGAQRTLAFLKKNFPDDPRVLNLDFSSSNMVEYTGIVQHIFFHPLIAYPERAFDGDFGAKGQDDYMATVPEFKKVIEQLYDKGYVLVDINSLYDAQFDANGRTVSVTQRPLYLPEGKKPYILSVDDINYYEYMKKDGQVFKLVLSEEGNVVTYSKDMEDQDVYSDDNDIVPILDKFVKEHPDSSINNAKGCLALTGYQGVLGYRTDEPTWDGYEQEKADALAVIARLKETGWVFASHSQGHRHSAQITLELFQNDTDRWEREVRSLIGPTSVYIYPFGEAVPIDGPKFDYLKRHGFAFFCTVSSNSRISWGDDYAVQGRRNIDGIALEDKRLYDLLDVPAIIDPVRPSYPDWVKWAKEKGIIR